MSEWIQQLQQERHKESQRQARFAEVFPALAEERWEDICAIILADLDTLQREYPDSFPSVPGVWEQEHRLTVKRSLSFPSYELKLTLNIPERKIYMEQYLRHSKQSRPVELKTEVSLSLDGRRESAQLLLNEEIFSLEEFSKKCLLPLVK